MDYINFIIPLLIGMMMFIVPIGAQIPQVLRERHPQYKNYLLSRAKHQSFMNKTPDPFRKGHFLFNVPAELDSPTFPSFNQWLKMEHVDTPMDLDFTGQIETTAENDYVKTFYFNKSDIIVVQRDMLRYIHFKTNQWECMLSHFSISDTKKKTYLIDGKYFVQGDLKQFEDDMISLRLSN